MQACFFPRLLLSNCSKWVDRNIDHKEEWKRAAKIQDKALFPKLLVGDNGEEGQGPH